MQNKDLPEDLDHPQQIDPDHDVGFDVGMKDDVDHDDTYTDDSEVDVNADDDDDDHDGDDDDEAVAGNNQ